MIDMKKMLLILCLFLLSSCGSKYYVLSVGEKNITVGKDDPSVLEGTNIEYETYIDEKDNEILKEIYLIVDSTNEEIKINNKEIASSVKETCNELGGEYSYDLTETCLIHKTVNVRENYIIIRGNILNDNVDEVDNITIGIDC